MQAVTNTMCRLGLIGGFVGLVSLGISAAGALTLGGQVTNAGTFTIGQLQSLGSVSESVGGNTYVGVPLWTLLGGTAGGASNVLTTGGGNNPILRNYLIATAADGSQSVLSVGEIDPLFGGTGQPDLVAYQRNGTTLVTPELILPQDPSGTRDVANLAGLSVLGVPPASPGPGGTTSQFSLSGVAIPGTFDLPALQGLPATTDHNVTFFSGSTPNGPHDYTGVSLWSLLVNAGIGDVLSGYVLATGSDGYQVLFSLAELDPAFGAPSDLVAYLVDGAPLGSSGFARTVLPGDNRGGRYVSNLASIQVASVPEPNPMALLGVGFLALTLVRRMKGSLPCQADLAR